MKEIYKIFISAMLLITAGQALSAAGEKDVQIEEPTKEEEQAGWRYFKNIGFKYRNPTFFDSYPHNIDSSKRGEGDKDTDEVLYMSYSFDFISDELQEAYNKIAQNESLSRKEKRDKIKSEIIPKIKPIYAFFTFRTPLIGKQKIEKLTGFPNNEIIRKTDSFTQVFSIANFNNSGLSKKSAEVYKNMLSQVRSIIPSISCTNPISAEAAMASLKKLTFDTVDLYGKRVTSSILKDYDVTMINMWATWCPPCRAELPELAKLYNAFKNKGCNILGIVGDVTPDSQEALENAKKLISDAGCKYPVVQNNASFDALFKNLTAWPTTIFVDKHGNVIASSSKDIIIGGRNLDEFTKAMEKALKTVKK